MVRVLSIDAGTSSIKVIMARLDGAATWKVEKSYAEPLAPPHCNRHIPGSSEQDANTWWTAMVVAVKAVLGSGNVDYVSLSGQMQSCLLVTADGSTIRPALLYSDTRATVEAEALEASLGRDRLLREATNWKGAASSLPKLCWLLAHEGENCHRADHICLSAHDYLFWRLTGVVATDPTNASVTGLLHAGGGDGDSNHDERLEWAFSLLADAGLPPDLIAKLPPVRRASNCLAPLSASAAAALGDGSGVLAGAKVCLGSGDLGSTTVGALGLRPPSSAAGLSALEDINDRCADSYCYLGTSGWVATVRSEADSTSGCERAFKVHHPFAGVRILAAPMTTAGGNVRWLCGLLFPGVAEEAALSSFESEARKAPAGCDGLLYLPYLQGERCPVSDPDARACFVGMGPHTGRAHMCRAVLEGIAFAVRSLLPLLPAERSTYKPHAHLTPVLGSAIEDATWRGAGSYSFEPGMIEEILPPIALVGGVANSHVLATALASVLNREVRVVAAPSHVPALGAAALAVAAAGHTVSATEEKVGAQLRGAAQYSSFHPNPNQLSTYSAAYKRFCGLHPSLQETFSGARTSGALD